MESHLRVPGLVAAILMVVGLTACPSPSSASPSGDARAPACTAVGQTCEYAPNKLGSCVQRDNCAHDCLVCQSQH